MPIIDRKKTAVGTRFQLLVVLISIHNDTDSVLIVISNYPFISIRSKIFHLPIFRVGMFGRFQIIIGLK